MAKYQAINQNFVVIEQTQGVSNRTGYPYTTITLVGVKDRCLYKTYIDTHNHNHKQWQHIVSNPDHGFILNNLRIKRHKDTELIDADSKPVIAAEETVKDNILSMLKEVWLEQDTRVTSNYRNLFE
jgi:hypothetical protein